jgi:hypothetical protein
MDELLQPECEAWMEQLERSHAYSDVFMEKIGSSITWYAGKSGDTLRDRRPKVSD